MTSPDPAPASAVHRDHRRAGTAGRWAAQTARLRVAGSVSLCVAACHGSWAADAPQGLYAVALASLPDRSAPAIEYTTATYPQLPSAASLEAAFLALTSAGPGTTQTTGTDELIGAAR